MQQLVTAGGAQLHRRGYLSNRKAHLMRGGDVNDSLFFGRVQTLCCDPQAVAYVLFALEPLAPLLRSAASTPRRMPDIAAFVYKTGRLSVGSCAVSTQGPFLAALLITVS